MDFYINMSLARLFFTQANLSAELSFHVQSADLAFLFFYHKNKSHRGFEKYRCMMTKLAVQKKQSMLYDQI